MKIITVSILNSWRKSDGRSGNIATRWGDLNTPLLMIETSTGVIGIGESWVGNNDAGLVIGELERLAPALSGLTIESPRDTIKYHGFTALSEATEWATAAAISAMDIAIWDACARSSGSPLWRLLGGSVDKTLVYASDGMYRVNQSLDDLETQARGYISRGFNAVKMKIGALPLNADIARVKAVRNAIGDRVLWVDASGLLNYENAMVWTNALLECGVSAIQSPVPKLDIKTMRLINRAGLPVISGHNEYSHAAFEFLLESGAVSYLQYSLGLCGGISGAIELDEMAKSYGVRTTPTCSATYFTQAATLQISAARRNTVSAEYNCALGNLSDICTNETGALMGGYINLGMAPGIGIYAPSPGFHNDCSVISTHRVFK